MKTMCISNKIFIFSPHVLYLPVTLCRVSSVKYVSIAFFWKCSTHSRCFPAKTLKTYFSTAFLSTNFNLINLLSPSSPFARYLHNVMKLFSFNKNSFWNDFKPLTLFTHVCPSIFHLISFRFPSLRSSLHARIHFKYFIIRIVLSLTPPTTRLWSLSILSPPLQGYSM